MRISPARMAAFTGLVTLERGHTGLPSVLARMRERLADPRDRALAHQIITGTLRWRGQLDFVIEHVAHRPLAKIDRDVLAILRLSAYQILFLSKVPDRAAIDEAAKLSRWAGKSSAVGFVNGALRAVARQREALPLPDRPREPEDPCDPTWREAALDYLSITLSHPRWLAQRWLTRFGLPTAELWARFNNTEPRLCLHLNRLRTDRATAMAQLAAHGIDVEPTRYAQSGLMVTVGHPLRSPLADTGLFFVQDEASQLVSEFAAARPGERVLDACAAPGGKTVGMAAQMHDRGLLVAADLRPARIALLARTVTLSGARSVRVVGLDLTKPLPFRIEFDCVLVDAPCSGLGTLRRDPDIRWRRTPDDLQQFADRQLRQLEQAGAAVSPGGRLVYATCSSEPEENDAVIDSFLTRNPRFRLTDPRAAGLEVAAGLDAVLDDRGFLRTAPHRHGLESFFAALLARAG